MDERYKDAACEAVARKLFSLSTVGMHDRPKYDRQDLRTRIQWLREAEPLANAALSAVDVLHALSGTVVIARFPTPNFEFEGVGADEHEALLALSAAWRKHCDQYREADPEYLSEFADSVRVVTYRLGGSYRDNEELT